VPELASTCSRKIPRSPSFPQPLSCSWLSSCRSRFKSVFSQLLFPGLPAAAAAVHSSWSPFLGRSLSSPPAAFSHPLPPFKSQSCSLISSQFFMPPLTKPCSLPSTRSEEAAGSAARSPPFEHGCLPSHLEKEPSCGTVWCCPKLYTCPEHFVSTESPTEGKDSYGRRVEI